MTIKQEKLLLENQIAIMGLLQYSNSNLSHDLSEECRVQIVKSKARIAEIGVATDWNEFGREAM